MRKRQLYIAMANCPWGYVRGVGLTRREAESRARAQHLSGLCSVESRQLGRPGTAAGRVRRKPLRTIYTLT